MISVTFHTATGDIVRGPYPSITLGGAYADILVAGDEVLARVNEGPMWDMPDGTPVGAIRFDVDEDLRAEVKAALEGDSNDAEHDALDAVAGALGIDWISFEDKEVASDLADLLNDGRGQTEALEELHVDPEGVSTEDPGLALDDPDNDIIDLCDGTYVQRHAGVWQVHTYNSEGAR
jgi:hypothetical protein